MSGDWSQAWLIVRRELKIDRYYLSASILFIGYMAFFGGLLIAAVKTEPSLSLAMDIIFWAITTMIGFYFSRRIMKYITEDSYTHMLAYYRSLPISPKVIALARCQQLILATVVNGVLLFGLMYAFHGSIREQFSVGAWISLAIFWAGFGLISNSIYIVLELLLRGKAYCWYSIAFMGIVVAIIVILHLSGFHIVEENVRATVYSEMALPITWIMLALGILSMIAAYRIIVQKLPRRNVA
ncbi:hypothetical protein [Saccharibacillus sp. JS10]|uniref:ABC-2 transporter permease n=1 Tax=Saccharibacillus sp. JS10 TaxID=2950552 RepID=UPI002109CFED|nr:hypothetical protein [Saccharibacillus sp. JS10]MCQ4087355.1 hypothetical protein [Saccharibacillus sp. JS10]